MEINIMEINKVRKKDRECWACNLKCVVWKDLNEKEFFEQLFE